MQHLDGHVRATPPLLRALNERAVLDVIRRAAPISRAEVARQSGISKPTVSSALRALLDAGLVREAEARDDGPSYGAVFFEPVPEAAIVLGIDIGARYLRAAIADLAGAIRARQDVELHGADAAGVLAVVDEVRASLLAASRLGEHHRGRHGAAGEIDLAYAGLGLDIDPCAAALEAYAGRVARNHVGPTALRAPYDTP